MLLPRSRAAFWGPRETGEYRSVLAFFIAGRPSWLIRERYRTPFKSTCRAKRESELSVGEFLNHPRKPTAVRRVGGDQMLGPGLALRQGLAIAPIPPIDQGNQALVAMAYRSANEELGAQHNSPKSRPPAGQHLQPPSRHLGHGQKRLRRTRGRKRSKTSRLLMRPNEICNVRKGQKRHSRASALRRKAVISNCSLLPKSGHR